MYVHRRRFIHQYRGKIFLQILFMKTLHIQIRFYYVLKPHQTFKMLSDFYSQQVKF